jgi:hypothetical protein
MRSRTASIRNSNRRFISYDLRCRRPPAVIGVTESAHVVATVAKRHVEAFRPSLDTPSARDRRYCHSIDDATDTRSAAGRVHRGRFLLSISNRARESHFAVGRLNDDMTRRTQSAASELRLHAACNAAVLIRCDGHRVAPWRTSLKIFPLRHRQFRPPIPRFDPVATAFGERGSRSLIAARSVTLACWLEAKHTRGTIDSHAKRSRTRRSNRSPNQIPDKSVRATDGADWLDDRLKSCRGRSGKKGGPSGHRPSIIED